ncbi:MAG: NAD(+)/NADH kinase [Lachnospiraceae bacterium]|nr:NAD(+)/NADH kinase [Lachnospiraceae bacterium]
MKSFCIVTNKVKDPDLKYTRIVRKRLEELGAAVTNDIDEKYECLIVLGGDGTIIEAVRAVKKRTVTVVGINLGHLGFLSSVEKNEIDKALAALVSDEYYLETRVMLEAGVERGEAYYESAGGREKKTGAKSKKESTEHFEFIAFNDVVINRMGYSGMITTDVRVNKSLVNSYFGDGVIVSTPTGSTGYNLSAGGPIVTPEAQLMVITPICPHSLSMRSVVVSFSDRIDIMMDLSRVKNQGNAVLTVDGQEAVKLFNGDRVFVKGSGRRVKLVRFMDKDFFKLLYMKLGEEK